MMKEFYSIQLSNTGNPILKFNEEEKIREERVSIWKQEEKVVICQLFPTGTIVLTNFRLIFILPSTAHQPQPIGWALDLKLISFAEDCAKMFSTSTRTRLRFTDPSLEIGLKFERNGKAEFTKRLQRILSTKNKISHQPISDVNDPVVALPVAQRIEMKVHNFLPSNVNSSAPFVLVTGINGFVASWITLGLLQQGYRVRGTARNIADASKTTHLVDMATQYHGYIEFIEADLLMDAGWDTAVADCEYIIHTACPVPSVEPADPNEVIKPAVEGTKRVFQAISRRQIPPLRVLITSSGTTMAFGTSCDNKVFSDEDWTCTNSSKYPIGSYPLAKTLAEKAAWAFVAALPIQKRFELVSINPTFAVGPLLSNQDCTSASIFRKILLSQIPGLANMVFDMVSVVDIAKAHLAALTHPQAAGKRFLIHSTQITMQQIAQVMKDEFSSHGYTPTNLLVPDWILRAVALSGDLEVKIIVPVLGVCRQMDPKNMRQVLCLQTRQDLDAKGLVLEMVYSAIYWGIIPDRSRDKTLTNTYKVPYFDLSVGTPTGSSSSGSNGDVDASESVRMQLQELQRKVSHLEGLLLSNKDTNGLREKETNMWKMITVSVLLALLASVIVLLSPKQWFSFFQVDDMIE
mmetsp:Transcript_26589/g.36631  ORF Transcript_26589/g.36631 Transcript_26589/m.36631 type:complete len:632 (+) Transcript_26589:71-1966(+)